MMHSYNFLFLSVCSFYFKSPHTVHSSHLLTSTVHACSNTLGSCVQMATTVLGTMLYSLFLSLALPLFIICSALTQKKVIIDGLLEL